MNQKGFATVLGLCLIMAIALCVKGIQEAQMNQSYVTSDFQAEVDLQNAADSGIYELAEKIHRELVLDKSNRTFVLSTTQRTSSGDISINVQAKRMLIFTYKVNYSEPRVGSKYVAFRVNDGKEIKDREIYTVSSHAEIYIEHIGRKISRNAFAYVKLDAEGNSDTTIHFMDNTKNLDDSLYYKPDDPTK